MRVLHIVGNLDINSGVMSMIMNYYRCMDTSNIQFDFLYFYDAHASYKDEIKSMGGNCFKIEEPAVKSMLQFFRHIQAFFHEKKRVYKAVHYHAVSPGLFCLKAASRNGVEKIIVHSHNTRYADYRIRSVRNALLTKATMKYKTHACACSQEAAQFLFGEKSISKNEVTIIRNAINYDAFKYSPEIRHQIRSELQLDKCLIIGHTGRLEKQKNHQFILEIFSEIKRQREDAVLILVGDGQLKRNLEAKAEALNIGEAVHFLGTQKDVNEIMQGMDIFLFPSLFEGLGIALIEAQVSGLLCIASDAVPKDTKITSSIQYLSLHQNAQEWAQIALRAYDGYKRKLIEPDEKFSIGQAVSDLEKLYRS